MVREGLRLGITSSLAFLSGCADVICLIRFESFATLQTGNAVFIGRDFVQLDTHSSDVLYHLTIIACNLLGVVLYQVISRKLTDPNNILLLSAVLIGLGTASADIFGAIEPSRWYVCFLAISFAAQNTLTFSDTRLGINTVLVSVYLPACLSACLLSGPRALLMCSSASRSS